MGLVLILCPEPKKKFHVIGMIRFQGSTVHKKIMSSMMSVPTDEPLTGRLTPSTLYSISTELTTARGYQALLS